jgi:RNA polymerase sigma-70 factor (ECF subfamily)
MLLALATRILGNLTDAEDIVQDAYLRWQKTDSKQVRSPQAFLTTTVTRLCLNHLNLSRVRAADQSGDLDVEWLLAKTPSPVEHAELADALCDAFVRLLETLSPNERAVFLLREAFQLDYSDIASVVQRSEENCRQMLSRARERITAQETRRRPPSEAPERVRRLFIKATQTGELDELLAVLSADAVLVRDGGDLSRPAPPPVWGEELLGQLPTVLSGVREWVHTVLADEDERVLLGRGGPDSAVILVRVRGGKVRLIRVVSCPILIRQLTAIVTCTRSCFTN